MNEKLIEYNANRTIAARKFLAESKSKENIERAMSFDGFSFASKEYNSLIPEIARRKTQNLPCEQLQEKLLSLQRNMNDILAKNGMSEKDLAPNYYCKKCNDTGFVKGVRCKCYFDMKNTLRSREINAEKLCSSFDTLSSAPFNDCEKANYEKLCAVLNKTISSFPNLKTRFLIFVGGTGTGKTYLSRAVAGEFEKKGFDSTFISAFNLSNTFMKYFLDFNEENVDYLTPLIDCDLLVIDDLGAEIVKNVTEKFLVNLLNERNAFHKLTIITTNLNAEEIKNIYGERVSSRIIDKNASKIIRFNFSDIRRSV